MKAATVSASLVYTVQGGRNIAFDPPRQDRFALGCIELGHPLA
jgi:hypothetical protein